MKAYVYASVLAVSLWTVPAGKAIAGHPDDAPDLRCLSNTLSEDAAALLASFDRDLRHSHAYPARGCDRELLLALTDFSQLAEKLTCTVRRGGDLEDIELLWSDTRRAFSCVTTEIREVRISDPTRERFAEAHEAACRFGRGFDAVWESYTQHHRHHHHTDREVIVVQEPVRVVEVVRQPSIEEQAVGLILQAISQGLNDNRHRPGCRH